MKETRPPKGTLSGEWDPPFIQLDEPPSLQPIPRVDHPHAHVWIAHDVLSENDCGRLIDAMLASGREAPVSVSGHPSFAAAQGDHGIGSVRATAWAPDLAQRLWVRVQHAIPTPRQMHDHSPTDWYALDGRTAHRSWKAVGLGPVLRFMRYEYGGRHCAHYDMGFDYPDARRSLMSIVFYLTGLTEEEGGCTRFVTDGQESIPVSDRHHDDWTREVKAEEVFLAVRPRRGHALIFDHRLCHDVERFAGTGHRVIVRGDVVFEALD